MKLGKRRRSRWQEVLVISPKRLSQTTVRRLYAVWRREQGIFDRCDNPVCRFHSEPLFWNGQPLPLIVDNREGNPFDNLPGSLRYLCPACDAQLPTRGGRNRGRVESVTAGGYLLRGPNGTKVVAATAGFGGSGSMLPAGAIEGEENK
jgi:hypothetical protein